MNRLAIGALLVLCPSIASRSGDHHRGRRERGLLDREASRPAPRQIRAFGEGPAPIRFFVEVAWGARYFPAARPKSATDVFGTAYPYQNRAQVIEAYGERTFRPGGRLVGIRPDGSAHRSGISTRSDHACCRLHARADDSLRRLLRAVEQLSGARRRSSSSARRRRISRPASAAAVGRRRRCSGVPASIRCSAAKRTLSLGDRRREPLPRDALPAGVTSRKGRAVFTGVDVRWMCSGIQLRGEVPQRPAVRRHDDDGRLHRPAGAPRGDGPGDGGRAALSGSTTTPFRSSCCLPRRAMAGARIRIPGGLTAQIAAGPPVAPADSAGPHGVRLRSHLLAPPRHRHPPAVSAPAATAVVIPWHRRLEARLALSVGLLVGGVARRGADHGDASGDVAIADARVREHARRADGVRTSGRDARRGSCGADAVDHWPAGLPLAHHRGVARVGRGGNERDGG